MASCRCCVMPDVLAGAFAEGMSLASKSDLQQDVLLDVLSKGAVACPLFAMKGPSMTKGEFPPAFPLKHQQKDMRLACELGCDALRRPPDRSLHLELCTCTQTWYARPHVLELIRLPSCRARSPARVRLWLR